MLRCSETETFDKGDFTVAVKKRVDKVIDQAIDQAKQSLKILEALEKETLAKAKEFVKIPISGDPKKLTNDKILASLRKIGLASQTEVDSLRMRVEKLEAQLALLNQRGDDTLPQ
jgi:polyhydroxyalkanoate synthesis regulator phasin